MLVSIIIPFYHGNQYVNRMIDMINRNQKTVSSESGINLEVLVINDSPTTPVEIDYQKCGFDLRIVNNEHNIGIHKTRARGLDLCNGEYVLFLDQDDIITDDCIFSQAKHIDNFDFCISNGYILEKNGDRKAIFESINHQKCALNLDFHYGYTNPIISPGQVLIKKSCIPSEWKNNCFVNNGADDHFLWLLLLEKGNRGTINIEKLYTHVATGNNTSLNVQGMCASNMELIGFLKGIASPKKLRMLKRRTLYYGNHPEKLITKLLFFDVGINRKRFMRAKN